MDYFFIFFIKKTVFATITQQKQPFMIELLHKITSYLLHFLYIHMPR